MSVSKAANAELKIQRDCDRLGVTREGLFWLDHALDPFKDMIRPHPGYPDKNMDPSVVEVVKQTVVVSAPAGGTNWDCSIFLDQVLTDCNLVETTWNSTFHRSGQGVTGHKRGGLVIRTAASGTPLDMTTTASNLPVDSNLFVTESSRVIGLGFEVHDTTAELHKQGSVVCWRLDQPTATPSVENITEDLGVTPCIPSAYKSYALAEPPNTASIALDLLGSVQWEAREGCYMVPVQTDDANPAMTIFRQLPVSVSGGKVYTLPITSVGTAKLQTITSGNVMSPWSMCGSFFSGLDPSASLTINFIYFIERFPNTLSPIKRLCYPSPPFDDIALTLYSDVARQLPVGVMVKENGAGDWIAGIAKVIGGIASAIPHPIAQTIGLGANFVGALASKKKISTNVASNAIVPYRPSNNSSNAVSQLVRGAELANKVIVEYNKNGKPRDIVVPLRSAHQSHVRAVAFHDPNKGRKRKNRLKAATKGMVQPDNSFKSRK